MSANGIVPAKRKFWLLLALGLVLNPVTVGVLFWNTVCPGFGKGPSMHPTIPTPALNFVDRLTYKVRDPKRGEIITFPAPWDDHYILSKRIVGLPGEFVEVDEGTVYINGEALDEPYLKIPYDAYDEYAYQELGPDQYWVMGDNRGNSVDSREFGSIQRATIRGREVGMYWPLSRATWAGLLLATLFWGTVLCGAAGFGVASWRAGRVRGMGGSVAFWGILFWAFGYWIVWRRVDRRLAATDATGPHPSPSPLTYVVYGAFQLWVSVGAVGLIATAFYPNAWRATAVSAAIVNVVASVIAFRRSRLTAFWRGIIQVGTVSVLLAGTLLVITGNPIACAIGGAAGAALALRARHRAKRRLAAAALAVAATEEERTELLPATEGAMAIEGQEAMKPTPSQQSAVRGQLLLATCAVLVTLALVSDLPSIVWQILPPATLVLIVGFDPDALPRWRHRLELGLIVGIAIVAGGLASYAPPPLDLGMQVVILLAAMQMPRRLQLWEAGAPATG